MFWFQAHNLAISQSLKRFVKGARGDFPAVYPEHSLDPSWSAHVQTVCICMLNTTRKLKGNR
jgi:hypothetical protein